MMRLQSLILLSCLLAFQYSFSDPTTEAGCLECSLKGQSHGQINQEAKEALNMINTTIQCEKDKENACEMIKWAQNKREEWKHCSGFFINSGGNIGEFGKNVSQLITQDIIEKSDQGKTSVYLKDYPQLNAVCPNLPKFSTGVKIGFYSYLMETLGYLESTCQPKAFLKAENVPQGIAVGMFQLEAEPHIRNWRPGTGTMQKVNGKLVPLKRCSVSKEEILTAKGNTGCAFDILTWIFSYGKPIKERINNGPYVKEGQRYFHSMIHPTKEEIASLKATRDKEAAAVLKKLKRKLTEDEEYKFLTPYDKFMRSIAKFPLCKGILPTEALKTKK